MDSKDQFLKLTEKVERGNSLSHDEADEAMVALMSGELEDSQIKDFLVAVYKKEVTIEELSAFATRMRDTARGLFPEPIELEGIFIDTCGTGGGTVQTFNISTAVTFVLASGGLKVAKHGNRAITSAAGSADVLEALGVSVSLSPEQVYRSLEEVGVGFLFAPVFHKAIGNVQRVRKELNHRTFFNVLGPLVNPFFPKHQVLGVYSEDLTQKVAEVLASFPEFRRAMVVHGLSVNEGETLDEISLLGKTKISEVRDDQINHYDFDPKDYGFDYCDKDGIEGGSPEENALVLKEILSGRDKGPKKDLVVLNAAAGFVVGEKVKNFEEGVSLAKDLISSGKPYEKVEALRKFSNSF